MNRALLKALGFWGVSKVAPTAAIRGLVKLLGSQNNDAAEAAYMALVQLGPDAGDQLVKEVAEGNQSASVLKVIGDLEDASIIPALEPFLKSGDAAVAAAAAESISQLRKLDEVTSPPES